MDNVIIVNSDNLRTRIDPLFFIESNPILEGSSITIGQISEFVTQGPNPTDWVQDGGVKCLKTKNVYDKGLVLHNIDLISEVQYEQLKRFTLQNNDILVTLKGFGSIGKVARYDLDEVAIFTREIGVIRIKKDSPISPEFLEIYLKTKMGKRELLRGITGATGQLTLTTSYIKDIAVPLISETIQQEIIKLVEDLSDKKSKLEQEYNRLLVDSDRIVEDASGFEIDGSNSEKIYVVNSDQLLNNRLDPSFFQVGNTQLINTLQSGKFPLSRLTDLLENVISGQRPKGGVRQIEDGIPSFGGEHILDDGSIKTSGLKFIPVEFHQKHLKSEVKEGDILLVKDGATTGKVGFVKSLPFNKCNVNEHLFILRTKSGVNPDYLFTILRSKVGQSQIRRQITGGTITGIVRNSLDDIYIPIPENDTQKQIANNSERQRNESIRLKETITLLEQSIYEEAEKKVLGNIK